MRQVEEVHGLFQFTDDFFPEADNDTREHAVQKYDGRYLDAHWYLDEEKDDALDFDVAKFKIDWLYSQRRHQEAYEVAQRSYERHGQNRMPRELLEVLVELCLALGLAKEADSFMEEVLSTGAQDPSIKWLRLRKEMCFGRWEAAYHAGLDYLEFRPHEYRVCLLMERACRQLSGTEWSNRAEHYAREAATIKHNYLRNL